MRWTRSTCWALTTVAALVAAGCTDSTMEPTNPPVSPREAAPDDLAARRSAPTQAATWNLVARELSVKYPAGQQVGIRNFAYLSVAQYNAAVAARKHRNHSSVPGAVAGASVAILSWIYPAEVLHLESLINPPDRRVPAYAAGVRLGRQIASRVIASALTDRFDLPWTGAAPKGPGFWFSVAVPPAPPIAPRLGEMRPFFLTSGSQFRPPPPPAFGSPAFLEALAEVRQISDTRTPEQDQIAKFWALPGGFSVFVAYHNVVATDLIAQYRLSEREAAHALALANQAAMDAFIGCWDAKYTYWYIRPSMVDPLIKLSVGLPNHPSYPLGHACATGAFMAVLAAQFPKETRRLGNLADQAALSRVLGGIHYRFDGAAGLRIGRATAAWALAHDAKEGRPYPIR